MLNGSLHENGKSGFSHFAVYGATTQITVTRGRGDSGPRRGAAGQGRGGEPERTGGQVRAPPPAPGGGGLVAVLRSVATASKERKFKLLVRCHTRDVRPADARLSQGAALW